MQLVDRVLKTIEILSEALEGMSVSDLSEALDMPPSSTHRVLKSLQDNHFVFQNAETKKYALSYKVYSICAGMRERNSLIAAAKPFMYELSRDIKMPIVLCVRNDDKIINLEGIVGGDASIFMTTTGTELPMYNTSAGRVFAASMPAEQAKAIFERTSRVKQTPYTKVELDELMEELEHIRQQGYALIDEELQLGIQGISCPIYDYRGKTVAALAATMIKTEHTVNMELVRRLKLCASSISREIS